MDLQPDSAKPKRKRSGRAKYDVTWDSKSENYREFERRESNVITEDRVPSSIQRFNTETGLHPTQKPQKLFEYLIQTYTNEGDVVCDPFGGRWNHGGNHEEEYGEAMR